MKLKAPEGCGGATYGDHTIELDERGMVDIINHPDMVKALKDHGFTEVTPESMLADRARAESIAAHEAEVKANSEILQADNARAEEQATAEADAKAEAEAETEQTAAQAKLDAAIAKKAGKPWQKATAV